LNKSSAILLFSRTAHAEAQAKPLVFDEKGAAKMAALTIEQAKKTASATGLPLFHISEKQQRGNTFGERFANAFEDIYAQGFENVIAIGNDCLTLTANDILKAAKLLETTPSVLGAATDGGAYLIGLNKSVFQKNDFQNIHWQTNSTFSELVQFVENQIFTIAFLSNKSDIDSVSDWHKTVQSVPVFLRKKLLQMLNTALPKPLVRVFLPINDFFLSTSIALRAPPIFA
jgi:uncharacterized protein